MSGDQDLLERATRALRESSTPSAQELAEGKAVLLWAQRAAQKKKRTRTLRWVLPLAAVLTAGSALAATEQIERVARAVVEIFTPAEPRRDERRRLTSRPTTSAPSTPTPAPIAPVQPAVEPPSEAPTAGVDAATATPEPPRSGDASRTSRTPRTPRAVTPAPVTDSRVPEAEPAPAPAPAEGNGQPPSDADLARYREAHNAHFRERDFSAALAAWDVYLHEFPQGTFVIEARYNRAICLVRLGRKDQARYALRPFAHGEIGRGYRQAEAKKLLEALE